jgi:hypothetical protein
MSRDSILLFRMKHYRRVLKFHGPEQNHPLRMWGRDILITAGYLFIRVLPSVVQFDATRFRDNILYSIDCIGPTENEIDDLWSWLLHFDIQGWYPLSSVNAYVREKLIRARHQAFSAVLVSFDCWPFRRLKNVVKRHAFEKENELSLCVRSELGTIRRDVLKSVFDEWLLRLDHCFNTHGKYVHYTEPNGLCTISWEISGRDMLKSSGTPI